jgi:hypothetical protein
MALAFMRVSYGELNGKQQEAYNFQKVSAVLADYGYVTIRLTSDWNGADFIAQHIDGTTFLKVQLKGRLSFGKKYMGQDLYICFNHPDGWFLYPHDEMLKKVIAEGIIEGTRSWELQEEYDFRKLSKRQRALLEPYRLEA